MDGHTRRRQPNVRGGRKNRVRVQLTDDEMAVLDQRADAEGLSVPHYLVRTALGAPPISDRAVMFEIMGIRRSIQTAANNLNQVARAANSGSYDEQAHDDAIGLITTATKRLNAAVSKYGPRGKNQS